MATKKIEPVLTCAGVGCSDGTCVACQVAQAAQHHAEAMEVGNRIAAAVEALVKATALGEGAKVQQAPQAAPAKPKPETKPEPTPETKPTPAPAAATDKLTLDGVRPRVLGWIKGNGRDKFLAVLGTFGAQKLPDVKDADLPKLMDALAAAGSF